MITAKEKAYEVTDYLLCNLSKEEFADVMTDFYDEYIDVVQDWFVKNKFNEEFEYIGGNYE